MTSQVTKSRNLPLTEYYSILQMEYISYYVRSVIYPGKYSEKYKQYCVLKKEKIDKIGSKNNLPSIFNNTSVRESYINKFFNPYGLPNFEYRDEESIRMMGRWDKNYWFSEGTSIQIRDNGGMVCTKIIKNLGNDNCVVAEINGFTRRFSYEFISRILTDKLINF